MSNGVDRRLVVGVVAMTHVDTGYIHTRIHELFEHSWFGRGRAERADDLGSTHSIRPPMDVLWEGLATADSSSP